MFTACFAFAVIIALTGLTSPLLVGRRVREVGSPLSLALGIAVTVLALLAATYVWLHSQLPPAMANPLGGLFWAETTAFIVWSISAYAQNQVYTKTRSRLALYAASFEIGALIALYFT